MKERKEFVLDTNVILHDKEAIFNFEENDILIPITVLDEVNSFKKGNSQNNFNAREFIRQLEAIMKDLDPTIPQKIKEGLGNIRVLKPTPIHKLLKDIEAERADALIISAALKEKEDAKNVVLVSRDLNIRMIARTLGLAAEDYMADFVDPREIKNSTIELEGLEEEKVNSIYKELNGFAKNQCECNSEFLKGLGKGSYVLKSEGGKSALIRVSDGKVSKVLKKRKGFAVESRNKEQAFAQLALEDKSIELMVITGSAGTGKTLLALDAALKMAKEKEYSKVYLSRPIVALRNKDLGHLPGDVSEKVGPYMAPLFDNLSFIKHKFKTTSKEYLWIDELMKNDELTIEALAFIRGRSLPGAFFIIDEAQNLTPDEITTIITRAGEGTKIVFTCDLEQIDTPYLSEYSNGPVFVIDKFKGQENFEHVHLVKGERSNLAALAAKLLKK